MNQIDWTLVGRVLTCWAIFGAILAPAIGKLLKARRAQLEFRAQLEKEQAPLPRDPMKYEGRDLTPEQKRAIEISNARLYAELPPKDGAFALDEPIQPRRQA